MQVLRFFEDRSAEIKAGKLTNRAIVVSDIEAYKIDTQAIGFYNPAKLFGYLPNKIFQIMTTRHPDSAPLRPLLKDYVNPNPVTGKELQEYEDQFYRLVRIIILHHFPSHTSPNFMYTIV